jgi:prepilin-type N-terminal cleavage/methylation domain-containing protein
MMVKKATNESGCKRRAVARGFSLIELVVVLFVILATSAIALPNFIKNLRASQLTNGATQVADILKLTRFQAIRRNNSVNCRIAGSSSSTQMWADANGNGAVDPGELQTLLSGNVNLVAAASVPGTTSLAASIGSTVVLVPVSPTAGTYTFDQRGAVTPAAVYVSYVTNAAMPALGYRAVVLLPSGSIQIWTGDTSGTWRLLE